MMRKRDISPLVGIRILLLMAVVVVTSVFGSANTYAAPTAAEYAAVYDASFYAAKYPDLKSAFGSNEALLFNHFLTCGMKEGRQGSAEFDVNAYRTRYPDLVNAFGDNLPAYYEHYILCGKAEGRSGLPVASGQSQTPGATTVSSAGGNSFADQVIALVNQQRVANGLPALVKDSAVTNCANLRANEITSVMSHNRPDGSTCFSILSQNGVSYSAAGENIAAGQTTPQEVVNAWMNSPGHRANILNPNYTKIGVGFIKVSSGYQYYWSQMFIR